MVVVGVEDVEGTGDTDQAAVMDWLRDDPFMMDPEFEVRVVCEDVYG